MWTTESQPDYFAKILNQIPDPEIPTISIVELGIVRDVKAVGTAVTVTITPTYSGCPAMGLIQQQIEQDLRAAGATSVNIVMVYSPPWSTAWLTPEAREKLKAAGIAPPSGLITIGATKSRINCPFCDSLNTELRSQFGATSCKALYFCKQCIQPFEYFKAI